VDSPAVSNGASSVAVFAEKVRQVVVTLKEYNACEISAHADSAAAVANFQSCVRVVKCYGRRLILDVEQCNSQQSRRQQQKQIISDSAVDKWIQAYATGDAVESIKSDSIVLAAALQSLLPLAVSLENLDNFTENLLHQSTASGIYSFVTQYQWNMDMVQARELWAKYSSRGDGSVIAVLDSGMGGGACDAFQGRIVQGYDFVSDEEWSKDGDGRDEDPTDPGDSSSVHCPGDPDSWHGTAVASVAAASYEGFEGVAPAANVMPVRVLGLCGTGYASDVADGIVWAAGGIIDGIAVSGTMNATSTKRKVILMLLSGVGPCPSYMQTAVDLAVRNGVGVFAAAGNNPMLNASDQFPANCRGAVLVGAWNWKKEDAFYSSKNPSIFMPGGDNEKRIPVLINDLQSGVWGMMGTSFAAPHAAGVWALLNISCSRTCRLPVPGIQ
jgi:subtilisin family serine protease